MVEDTEPSTFLPILKELDIPYMPGEWRSLLVKKAPTDGSMLGKYASKMKLHQYKKYCWADSERLAAEEAESLLTAMRQQTDTETEAEEAVHTIMTMQDIPRTNMKAMETATESAALYGLTAETSKYGLTDEEINELKMTWGQDYGEDEFYQLEQQLNDMKESYVIQDPIAISNAKMICKMTLKMNKFLDIDDVESVSKIARQLDLFIKTANLAPVQQKDRQSTTFAIAQLSYLIEQEGGFVEEYAIVEPNDKIDMILKDMEEYTDYLVRGESGIAEMLENTQAILAQDERPEAVENFDEFAALEAEVLQDLAGVEENQEEEEE